MSNLYKKLNKSSHMYDEEDDCAVIATAAVCGITYKKAHTMCKKAGRKNKDGMLTYTMIRMLEENGYYIESNILHPKQPNGHGYTAKTIEKALKLNKRYLVFLKDHVFAMIEKDIIDTYARNRNFRIERLIEVVDVN